jgi:exonuclease SbcD
VRYAAFEAFLNWLANTLCEQEIPVLLIAGDIFDTSTPGNRAQALYYRFLHRVATSPCRHIVVIAGNHDSPSFLGAPRELLKALDVHVVAEASESAANEVLVLRDAQGTPELIVCAVPYLRDKDIRVAEAGESVEDKEQKQLDGIRGHYAAVAALAAQQRTELGADIPVVAMGHLFTAGGQTVEGDGVRELYVGTLPHVTAGSFPASFDYVALGHLHVPQKVNGSETLYYSGSPLPMGFGEATQEKSVCLVSFQGTVASVQQLPVPVFQELARVTGDEKSISQRIRTLAATGSRAWLEIVYEGDAIIGDLREQVNAAIGESQMEVLRVKNNRTRDRALEAFDERETLDDLDLNEVFTRCLNAHDVPEEQRTELYHAYREIVVSLHEEDPRAE